MDGLRYVIDRQLPPGLFQRAPGALEILATEDGTPITFESEEAAQQWLRDNVDMDAYKWNVLPESEIEGGK